MEIVILTTHNSKTVNEVVNITMPCCNGGIYYTQTSESSVSYYIFFQCAQTGAGARANQLLVRWECPEKNNIKN